jgi:hypothetical protein
VPAAQPSELGSFLGAEVDLPRAEFFLDLARDLVVAESGIPTLTWPAGLRVVQITCAARGYTNPAGKGQATTGSMSYTVRDVGIYLTDAERNAIRAITRGSSNGLTSVPLTVPAEVYPSTAWVQAQLYPPPVYPT